MSTTASFVGVQETLLIGSHQGIRFQQLPGKLFPSSQPIKEQMKQQQQLEHRFRKFPGDAGEGKSNRMNIVKIYRSTKQEERNGDGFEEMYYKQNKI